MAARKKQRKSARSGCLLWLAAFILLLVLFFVKFGDIKAAIQKTGFLDAIHHALTKPNTSPGAAPSPAPSRAPVPASPQPPSSTPAPVSPQSPSRAPIPASPQPPSSTSAPASPPGQNVSGPAPEGSSGPASAAPSENVVPPASQESKKSRNVVLYFVRIDDSGAISSQKVKRTLPISDSPIQDTLDQLIKGPTQAELRANLISLIPSGTKLRGISVRGSTAIVDFNDAFLYNRYGKEGYVAQLRQVVYTLTEFANITEVQFLIEGKPRDYITEGVALSSPWSRGSF